MTALHYRPQKRRRQFIPPRLFILFLILAVLSFSGCAYYNYFYNARQSYKEGERQRQAGETGQQQSAGRSRSRGAGSAYDRCIESAGRMLEYYPNNRWEDDALLLLTKAYYWSEKYRNAIGKADELAAKYPASPLVLESRMWKGISLLKVEQPDSSRQILTQFFLSEAPVDKKAMGHLALGNYYFSSERWDSALDQFRQILNSGIEDKWLKGQALLQVGECLKRMARSEEAIKLYEDILAGKADRRLRFDAAFQRAIALREAGRIEEARSEFARLLKDAAFQEEFPKIELEEARCLRALGDTATARKRLEELIEAEKRGEIAAAAQYELGLLAWDNGRDFTSARTALSGVKKAESRSVYGSAADSLLKDIERLSRFWFRLRFFERQISVLDSASQGLRPLLPKDTVYVDSVQIALKEDKKPERERKRPDRRNDPLLRMVEQAKAAGDTLKPDSAAVQAAPDTSAGLDSTVIANLTAQRQTEQIDTWFELAGYHMFERSANDSSRYYYQKVLATNPTDQKLGQILASLAYMARGEGDSTAHDSLYRQILEEVSDELFRQRARRVLGLEPHPTAIDTVAEAFKRAEELWTNGDPATARKCYLGIAALADSTSPIRARALFAAGFISRRELGEDSTAIALFKQVVKEFDRTDWGRKARELADRYQKGQSPQPQNEDKLATPGGSLKSGAAGLAQPDWSAGSNEQGAPEVEENIYLAEDVDEPPLLITPAQSIRNYTRSYYPFQAQMDNLRGEVDVEVVVNAGGEKSEILVLTADPEGYGFEEAALQVMEKLDYQPARQRGQRVSVRLRQHLTFNPNE
ncbi:MAG: tetratricopeptide repeat protein [Calditrichota bacterium]